MSETLPIENPEDTKAELTEREKEILKDYGPDDLESLDMYDEIGYIYTLMLARGEEEGYEQFLKDRGLLD